MFCGKLQLRSFVILPTVALKYGQRQTVFDTDHLQRVQSTSTSRAKRMKCLATTGLPLAGELQIAEDWGLGGDGLL